MAPIQHVYTSPQADVTDTALVRPTNWNSVHAYTLQDAVSLSGNTAGVLANISSGTLYLAGGNNITLSQGGNSVTISGGAGGAQTEQTQSRFNLTLSGNTAGALALISSGVMTLAGGNNVTLSQAGNAVTVSAVATVAQTAQTQNLHNVTLAGNTAGALAHVSSGTLTLAGGNNVTLSQAGNAVTISGVATVAQTVQTQNLHNVTLAGNTAGALAHVSSGTLTLAGGNNITLSQAGNAVTVSAANTVAQTEQTQSRFNLTLGGNTSGALALISSGVLTLAGGSNITLSQAGNAVTISGATAAGGGPPIATSGESVASANSVGTVTRYAAEDHRHAGSTGSAWGQHGGHHLRGRGLAHAGWRGEHDALRRDGGRRDDALDFGTAGRLRLTLALPRQGRDQCQHVRAGLPDDCVGNLMGPLTASKACFYGSVAIANAANNSSAFLDMSILFGLYTRNASTLFSLTTVTTLFSTSWTSNVTGAWRGCASSRCRST